MPPDDQTQVQERSDAQVEADATLVGWQPEDKFPGDKSKWKPAAEFLALAESQLPMARAQNRRLTETNQELVRRLKAQESAMAGLQESIEALKEFHSADTKRKVAEAREKLKGELKAARAAGDVDAEVEIIDALNQGEKQTTNGKDVSPPATVSKPVESPDWKAWKDDNPKFGSDKKWRGVCIGIAEELRMDPAYNHLQGRAFFDEVSRQTDAWFGQRSTPPRTEKTEAGGNGGTGGGGGSTPTGKSYAQLPPEAKAQCNAEARKFVGKGFKTLPDWQAYYAKTYWENE